MKRNTENKQLPSTQRTGGALSRRTEQGVRRRIPLIDVYETNGDYVVLADLPGVSNEDLLCEIDQNALVIGGRRSRREHGTPLFGGATVDVEFQRRLELPDGVDATQIKADFKNGTLRVNLPKQENLRPRRIEIQH